MTFRELEYKYKADQIQLSDFVSLMETAGFLRKEAVSSWDIYYTQEGQVEKFQRFRIGDAPELTKKIKTKDSNNWVRTEVDLPLDPLRVTEEIVSKFVSIDGYSQNFKVYKTCFIFWQENLNYVFYFVYDANMQERGSFIEVEVNKSKVLEVGEVAAMEMLNAGEALLEKLGITSQNRMKRSLFEIFRK